MVYLVLALTFGFTLLATELTIGRRTRSGRVLSPKVVVDEIEK